MYYNLHYYKPCAKGCWSADNSRDCLFYSLVFYRFFSMVVRMRLVEIRIHNPHRAELVFKNILNEVFRKRNDIDGFTNNILNENRRRIFMRLDCTAMFLICSDRQLDKLRKYMREYHKDVEFMEYWSGNHYENSNERERRRRKIEEQKRMEKALKEDEEI